MITAFAGLGDTQPPVDAGYTMMSPGWDAQAPVRPGSPYGVPTGSIISGAMLTGPYPSTVQAPGNPPFARAAMAPALFRSLRSYNPMTIGPGQAGHLSPAPAPPPAFTAPARIVSTDLPCPCLAARRQAEVAQAQAQTNASGTSGFGGMRFRGLRGTSGLGEITTGDILNSGATLAVLAVLTAGALYWHFTSKDDPPPSSRSKIDWDRLGKEWDEAASRR